MSYLFCDALHLLAFVFNFTLLKITSDIIVCHNWNSESNINGPKHNQAYACLVATRISGKYDVYFMPIVAKMPYAQMPYAQMPYAQMSYAQMSYAQMPYVQMPYAQMSYVLEIIHNTRC